MHPNSNPEAKTLDVLDQLLQVRELPHVHKQRTVADFPKIINFKLSIRKTTVLDLIGESPKRFLIDFSRVSRPGRPDRVLNHSVVRNARRLAEIRFDSMLMSNFRVIEEPNVVFKDVLCTQGAIRVGDFSDQTDMVLHDVVVVNEEWYFGSHIDVHAVGVEPIALANSSVVFFF